MKVKQVTDEWLNQSILFKNLQILAYREVKSLNFTKHSTFELQSVKYEKEQNGLLEWYKEHTDKTAVSISTPNDLEFDRQYTIQEVLKLKVNIVFNVVLKCVVDCIRLNNYNGCTNVQCNNKKAIAKNGSYKCNHCQNSDSIKEITKLEVSWFH